LPSRPSRADHAIFIRIFHSIRIRENLNDAQKDAGHSRYGLRWKGFNRDDADKARRANQTKLSRQVLGR
jgi:hypothetical protein